MASLVLCLLFFLAAFMGTRRSLVLGLAVVLTVGYLYGILRANLNQPLAHFLFDAAVVGLFAAQVSRPKAALAKLRRAAMQQWFMVFAVWTALVFLLFQQDAVIQLVGLRGNLFLLPFILLASDLDDEDLRKIAHVLAGLNLIALGFAFAEYFIGVPKFFPYNAVTEIIYRSNDVAGWSAYRIPACFASAHAFGGTLVTTLPLILGAWGIDSSRTRSRQLLAAGAAAAGLGVFMCAARVPALIFFVLVVIALVSWKTERRSRLAWMGILMGVFLIVSKEQRFQRFTTLKDPDLVTERIAGSVNSTFIDLVFDYPLGNGLGGGGTSIPYFLQNRLRSPVTMENEYARIALELGLPGLMLWLAFFAFVLVRRPSEPANDPWKLGKTLGRTIVAMFCLSALLGTGLFTSIPQSALLLFVIGWITTQSERGVLRRRERQFSSAGAFLTTARH